jgi:outer membrane biosynthesis protein TonB
MAKTPPLRGYGAAGGRFWRNVVLIAVAHVALIAVLIRWSLAARASSNPESIVWLGGAGSLAAQEPESEPSPSAKRATPPEEAKLSKEDEVQEHRPVVAAKSEIELPSPTPKPTPTPKAFGATPTPKPKTTPKPIPKPSPKKALLAKASSKPSPKALKERRSPDRRGDIATLKSASQSNGTGSTGSTGKGGNGAGGTRASEFGWYGNMLHDRFYSAWIQPTTHVPTGAKISTLVRVRIEKDGRVSKFEIIKPSENAVVNESVAAVAKQVTAVDSPPTGLIKGNHYDVKINFELNTEE